MPDVRLLEVRNTYKWGGGPDKTILLSAEKHDTTRVKVVVAYIRDVNDGEFRITNKARAKGLTYHEIEERGKFDLRVLRALRDLIVQYDINVIHGHDYKSDLFAYLVRKWLWNKQIALVSTAHGWALVGARGELYRKMDLFLMRRFDRLIAVSHATKDLMVSDNVPAGKISVIHNAIDTETWSRVSVKIDLRKQLGLDKAFPVVGYVGRLTEEKELGNWLRVAHRVATKCQHARFVIVGEGRDEMLRAKLVALAQTLGIADRVLFLGYREDLVPIYAMFDVFLLASSREGLCNSILEAMSLGVPVVSTDVGGSRELVVDGQTGFLLSHGDVDGLAAAVLLLAESEPLRLQLGQGGRHRIEQDFAFGVRLRRVEDLYEEVIASQGPHSPNLMK